MLTIQFDFTANRYHATQWGRHVNEGVLEWPPSPWRILRAIVATWRRTLPDIPADRVAPILESLASERPSYSLPPASTAHTRHYMPYNEGSRERTTLVIDSFVAIQPQKPVYAVWQGVELDHQQTADLSAILRNMPYLGRAESWVESSLAFSYPKPNSAPMENGALPEGDIETVRTLVPRTPIRLEDLMIETSELRRAGRIDPERAQWWMYTRKANCFTEFRSHRPRRTESGEGANVVRFALSSNVLPMVKDTLRWGELARSSAMAKFGRQNDNGRSETLSGKDESGKPLKGHKHAFYLPTDEEGDGKLDHLTVWAPEGLTAKEFKAVASLTKLKPPGRGRDPVQLAYQSHGGVEDFVGVSPLFDVSKRWRSLTPYVLTRHVKFRGPKDENGQRRMMVDGPEDQIRREVSLRSHLSDTDEILIQDRHAPIPPMRRGRSDGIRPIEFFRHRRGGGSRGGGAYSFEIEFDQSVDGPIALGFACHYGLGLFVPASNL